MNQEQIDKLLNEYEKLYGAYMKIKQENKEYTNLNAELKMEIDVLIQNNSKLKDKFKYVESMRYEQTIDSLEAENKRLNIVVQQLQVENDEKPKLAAANVQIENLKTTILSLQDELKAQEDREDILRSTERQMRKEFEELATRVVPHLKRENDEYAAFIKSVQAEHDAMTEERETIDKRINFYKSTINSLNEEVVKLKEEIRSLNENKAQNVNSEVKVEAEKETLFEQLAQEKFVEQSALTIEDLKNHITKLESRVESLEHLQKD